MLTRALFTLDYRLTVIKGEIYVKFETVNAAKEAIEGLNGRWFGGRQITAAFISDAIMQAHQELLTQTCSSEFRHAGVAPLKRKPSYSRVTECLCGLSQSYFLLRRFAYSHHYLAMLGPDALAVVLLV